MCFFFCKGSTCVVICMSKWNVMMPGQIDADSNVDGAFHLQRRAVAVLCPCSLNLHSICLSKLFCIVYTIECYVTITVNLSLYKLE